MWLMKKISQWKQMQKWQVMKQTDKEVKKLHYF